MANLPPCIAGKRHPLKIIIETEVKEDPNALFRVTFDGRLIGEHLTAVQAQIVIAELMERVVLLK